MLANIAMTENEDSARCVCACNFAVQLHHHLLDLCIPFAPSLNPNLQALDIPPSRQRIDSGLGAGGAVQAADLVQLEGMCKVPAI